MLPLQALREALAGWRKTKHPRFAAIAHWATVRALAGEAVRHPVGMGRKRSDSEAWRAVLEEDDPLDLPRLLKAVGGGASAESVERIALLSKLNDPRVSEGLLELLAKPPYRARTALPFFRACAQALLHSGDPRVRPGLEELAARYKAILETSVGDDVTALLLRTAASIDEVKPGPLSAALEKQCTELEALFETERAQSQRGAVRQQSAQHDDAALLAAIYAAPDDDTPRLVFADALTERGDARGEFIALQLSRAKGKATPAQLIRERELSTDARRRVAWGLPLSQGGACHLSRGFPDELVAEPRIFKTIVGQPAASTLRKVSGFERQVSIKQAKTFLFHEATSRLTSVHGLNQELLEALDVPAPWPSVGLSFLPTREQLAPLVKVKDLSLGHYGPALTPGSFVGMEQLETLRLGQVTTTVLAPLVALVELHVAGWLKDFHWAQELAGMPKLTRLVTGSAPTASQLEGLKLETLSCHASPDLDTDAIIAALPKLVELRMLCSDTTAAVNVARVLTSKRHTQLRLLAVGSYEFKLPGTPEGTLEIRAWSRMNFENHAQTLALLPAGFVSKVVVRPRLDDPWAQAGMAPEAEAIEALRAAAKVPVELAWY